MSGLKKGLGKGLDSLLAIDTTDYSKSSGGIMEIPLSKIQTNQEQPRKDFQESTLSELADSIKEKGVIQPIIVEEIDGGLYRIIAGERRFRASKMAGLEAVPAIVREYTMEDAYEIALIENIQREDLNAIEEAMGYKTLMEKFNLTQDEVSKKVGKNRATVANSLRLLRLPQEILSSVVEGEISAGMARTILSVEQEQQINFFNTIKNEGLSVREAEQLARTLHADIPSDKKVSSFVAPKSAETPRISVELAEIEEKLRFSLGTKVSVKGSNSEGRLEIYYYSVDDLERISSLIAK